MVDIAVFHLDASQHLVPPLAPLALNALQVIVTQFLEVQQGLLGADER